MFSYPMFSTDDKIVQHYQKWWKTYSPIEGQPKIKGGIRIPATKK